MLIEFRDKYPINDEVVVSTEKALAPTGTVIVSIFYIHIKPHVAIGRLAGGVCS